MALQIMSRNLQGSALPVLFDRLSADCLIILDDVKRKDEQQTIEMWKSKYSFSSLGILNFEKGAAIIHIEKIIMALCSVAIHLYCRFGLCPSNLIKISAWEIRDQACAVVGQVHDSNYSRNRMVWSLFESLGWTNYDFKPLSSDFGYLRHSSEIFQKPDLVWVGQFQATGCYSRLYESKGLECL